MTDTYTKDEVADLKRAEQDIQLFLRLARLRIETHPEVLPFKAINGQHVIGWLCALAIQYGNGKVI